MKKDVAKKKQPERKDVSIRKKMNKKNIFYFNIGSLYLFFTSRPGSVLFSDNSRVLFSMQQDCKTVVFFNRFKKKSPYLILAFNKKKKALGPLKCLLNYTVMQ